MGDGKITDMVSYFTSHLQSSEYLAQDEQRPPTPREIEILRLLARGLKTQEIADQLCLSSHTVSNHVRNPRKKLGASTRMTAVFVAQDRGLI